MNELMTILMEECAEVTVAASKIIRFDLTEDNRKRLEEEVGDLMCMVQLLEDRGLIDPAMVALQANEKRKKLKIYSKLELQVDRMQHI